MNRKKIIISILLTLALILGTTYAMFNVMTEKTDVNMVMDGDQVSFNAGQNITVTGILPVYDMEQGIKKDIEIYKENGNYESGINLFLKLTTFPSGMASNSFKWALYKNGNYFSSGNFLGTKQGDVIKLTSTTQKLNTIENKDNYKLYLWIDAYSDSGTAMMNQSFTVSIYGEVTFYDGDEPVVNNTEPNAPDLADGMIPVKYNYFINEWVKADSSNPDNSWYDYNNKNWANAVLVDSAHRDSYMNASVDTTIAEEHILAYYVWIPRYKYVLFNVASEEIDPREIQIEFEKETDTVSKGTQNGEFLSHPAFWWDKDSNGQRPEDGSEEIAGIWVGKFETSGTVAEPRIKPNVVAATGLNVSNLFNMNRNIQSTSYLTDAGVSETDPHMMKNTQWGAVAYLSHSRYGINTEIAINDNTGMITGRQGDYTYNDFLVVDGKIKSSKSPGTGVKASTTGNVSGIYDMSGGASEYVMALMKSSSTSNVPFYQDSGFNNNNKPLSKYYDLYDYGTGNTEYQRRILGDATGETSGWYGDYKYFIYSVTGIFRRGGYYGDLSSTGLFHFYYYPGYGYVNNASRSVIVLP